MFSPYYAAARRHQDADPENHCAINVVLHGRRRRWTMTERGRAQLQRSATTLTIGPSQLRWDGQALQINLDEVSCPWPMPVRGLIRFTPTLQPRCSYALDDAGQHLWTPIAPQGRVEVAFTHPAQRWSGQAYLDHNRGNEPLENAFDDWQWSRTSVSDGAELRYEVNRRQGKPLQLALHFDHSGKARTLRPASSVKLPHSGWGIQRSTRCDPADQPRIQSTLLDAPFYARSLIATHRHGQQLSTIHESLSLKRFSNPWVQAMLRFRIPRAWR